VDDRCDLVVATVVEVVLEQIKVPAGQRQDADMFDVLFHGVFSEFVGEDVCYGLGVSGFERLDNGRVFKRKARVYAVLKAQG